MQALPLWSRALAFLGAAFAVWMISCGVVAGAFSLSIMFDRARLPFVVLIVLFLALQLFLWWRLWAVIVGGGRFWPRRRLPLP